VWTDLEEVAVTVDEPLNIELEALAAIADREIRASKGTVSGRWSCEAHAACTAITERLKVAGVDRVIAEWTTTIWILGGHEFEGSVLACMDKAVYYAEIGLIHPARTGDGPDVRA
jgi:hypothetical protein